MAIAKKPAFRGRKLWTTFILLFCIVVAIGVVTVLLFFYEPNQNALGALGTVCLDVFSMMTLLILILSLLFDEHEMNRTTKLFLCLMLGTLFALFFDFLTWSSDGNLAFADKTYVFTVCSLCCGSILAAVFSLYVSSYMHDMYEMKSSYFDAKICVILNAISFVITVVLALTKTAFDFVDGHYVTGALYDGVAVIPILTLIYVTIYAIRHVDIIGVHDATAVAGYILTMIIGAVIEAIFSIGTTYVSLTIADIFIFLMLQNRYIDRIKKQRELLTEQISSQFEILESMAGIYSYVNYVDLEDCVARRFDEQDSIEDYFDIINDPHTSLTKRLHYEIEDELKDKFWAYTDLSTLPARMANDKLISAEFCHKQEGWFRAQYIRIGDETEADKLKVIFAIRNIDEEKKNVEKWIRKSNTDELTGFYNRHAYEDEIASLEGQKIKDNFVYVSMDVNSLKIINDTLGHEAGDELLLGACECMKQSFGSYGKIFRTGGDEFVALIFADDAQLKEIKNDINELTENWRGKLVDTLAVSFGYVTWKEADMSLHRMAVLADKRMYDDKTKYYQQKGIDRRGQRDAHVALCALYTKILKINATDDTYQIVNMNDEEQSSEMGFSESLSEWLTGFGTSGQVHPDDLDEYLAKTNLEVIKSHFKNSDNALTIFYRRKTGDTYKKVMMEIIPANNYQDDSQNLFLYVKNIE